MLLKKYESAFFLFLFLVFALPILALAWYNVPSAADDFCFALNTIKFGFWQGQQYYYDQWTGRYFSTFLMHANPLVFKWLNWYRVFPILTMLGLLHSLYSLSKAIFGNHHSKLFHCTLGAAFLFLYLYQLPSVAEIFFWLPGVVGYPLSLILLNYFFVAIIGQFRHSNSNTIIPIILQKIWICFLIFAIVGSNETPMLAIVMIMAFVFFVNFWQGYQYNSKRFDNRLVWLLLPLSISLYLELSAPGNAVRMSYNPHSQEIIPSILASLKDAVSLAIVWISQTPLLFIAVLFLFLAGRLLQAMPPATLRIFDVPLALSLLLWLGLFSVGIFPGYYGVGMPPPPRTVSIVYWFFLLGFFYNLLVIIRLLHKKNIFRPKALPNYAQYFMAFWLVLLLWQSPTIRPLYGDLLKGRAALYHKEMTERFDNKFKKGSALVQVDSLTVYPKTLFVEDITNNPKHLWNGCQAEFWEVDSLKIK
jgi:hypothetical protein